jgi:hypothetical protein
MKRVCLERSDDKLSSCQSGKMVYGTFLTLRGLLPFMRVQGLVGVPSQNLALAACPNFH